MQPEALHEAQDWLLRAERDLLIADRAIRSAPVLADQAVFHAQQASEKALKAFLAAHDEPLQKTHNLERLVVQCEAIDVRFADFLDTAWTLNPYVTQFRYPGGPLEPDLAEAEQALQLARDLVQFVRERLPSGGAE